jgi:hypothetical protein
MKSHRNLFVLAEQGFPFDNQPSRHRML